MKTSLWKTSSSFNFALDVRKTILGGCLSLTLKKGNSYDHFQALKSILVDGNRYLKELIRYIHLYPVRAIIVDDPLDYRWSSHQAYLMNREFTRLKRDNGLKIFGEFRDKAMEDFINLFYRVLAETTVLTLKRVFRTRFLGTILLLKKCKRKSKVFGTIELSLKILKHSPLS